MNIKQFSRSVRQHFNPCLASHGFSCDRSRHGTFYRQLPNGIYHVIMPDLGTRGVWYDINVFATSPAIEPLFAEKFPDELGITSDIFSYLSETAGVGPDQQTFGAKTEEQFSQGFERRVRRLLLEVAVPYLDRIRSFEVLLPLLRHPWYLAFGLHHVGRIDEAKAVLTDFGAQAKLSGKDPTVVAFAKRASEILSSP